jgi:hypothetical protein
MGVTILPKMVKSVTDDLYAVVGLSGVVGDRAQGKRGSGT